MGMLESLTRHWPEYPMEAIGLGFFRISAFIFGTILQHLASPIRQAISEPILRRLFMGIATGLTAIGIIHWPWGKQSRAHIDSSVTLAFFRPGKLAGWDTIFWRHTL